MDLNGLIRRALERNIELHERLSANIRYECDALTGDSGFDTSALLAERVNIQSEIKRLNEVIELYARHSDAVMPGANEAIRQLTARLKDVMEETSDMVRMSLETFGAARSGILKRLNTMGVRKHAVSAYMKNAG